MTYEKGFQKLTPILNYYFTDQNSTTKLHLTGREIGNCKLSMDSHISNYDERDEWELENQ